MSEERESGVVRRVQPQDDRQSRRPRSGSGAAGDDERRGRGAAPHSDASADGDSESSEMVSAYGDKSGGKDSSESDSGDGGPSDGAGDKKKKDGKKSGEKDSLKKRLIRIYQAMMAAKAVAKGMFMAQMMLYLKAFLQAMLALVQAAAAAVASAVAAAIQTVVTVATTVATAIGVSVAVATGGIAALLVVAVLAAVVVAGNTTASNVAQRDDGGYDCNTNSSYMQPMTPADPSEQTLANAKLCYAFFKAYGLPDENIAGILGNWNHESGIDPTGTETIYSEPFTIPVEGTRKYDLWKGRYWNQYDTLSEPVDYTMVKTTSGSVEYGLVSLQSSTGINEAARLRRYHERFPAISRIGIGLGQWTNGRNQRLLDFSDMMSLNWYDIETQLMFMVCPEYGDDSYHLNLFAGWDAEDSPESAARWFLRFWEGGGESGITSRIAYAEQWYVTMQGWVEGVDYDLAYAQSLLDAVEAAGSMAGDRAGSANLRQCSGYVYADNSSAAKAAVAFSWGPGEEYENDGTGCWQHLADALYAGDVLYRSCDRTVAAALWWSGTDSEFPKNLGRGNLSGQLPYMVTSDNWTQIDWDGDYGKLQPGDVLIRNDDIVHHVVMYVGPDAPVERFGETYDGHDTSKYVFVSGSAGEYSPHVGMIYTDPVEGFQTYYAFRCVRAQNLKPENSTLTCVS